MKQCPTCGAHKLVTDTRDVPVSHQGHHAIIPSVTGEYCQGCGEIIFDIIQGDLYMQKIREFINNIQLPNTHNNSVKE